MKRYLVLSEGGGDFEVSATIHAIYHPIGAVVVWAPKTENVTNFTKFRYINASNRRIPSTIFKKFSGIVGSFGLGHLLKFGEIRSRGSGVPGVQIRGV